MREWLEYSAAWLLLKTLSSMPRPVARAAGVAMSSIAFRLRPPLRRAANWNLRLAFPEWDEARRSKVIRGLVRSIGWMAGEFSQFPKYTRLNIERIVVL